MGKKAAHNWYLHFPPPVSFFRASSSGIDTLKCWCCFAEGRSRMNVELYRIIQCDLISPNAIKKNWTTFHYSAAQLSQTQSQSKQKAFHGEEVGYSGQVTHMILIWLSCIPSENQSKWAKSDSERIFRENSSICWSLWVKCLMKSLTEKQCSGNRFY